MKKLTIVVIAAAFVGIFLISKNKSTPAPDKSPLRAQSVNFNETITVSLTPITTYLANPGIGWQEAHTFSAPLLLETVSYRRPQYSWKLQNPAEGIFNWAAVDADLAGAVAQGKQFSFRIYSANATPQLPDWVIAKGAKIINDNPDYSNCVYQEEWAKFVTALKGRYDGNPNIAFIDISGYGNYNEWGWTNGQTEIDSEARRRLADMFMGGAGAVTCHKEDGSNQTVNYSYPGFIRTQLIMPFAGISESNRYVAGKRSDIGFRNDCLGRADTEGLIMGKLGGILSSLWTRAPVVYEYCGNTSTTPDLLARANSLLKLTHGSLTHDNFSGSRDRNALMNILNNIGYRYLVKNASWHKNVPTNSSFDIITAWSNIGNAPNYPRMGQNFALHYYLTDNEKVLADIPSSENIHAWLPGERQVTTKINLPAGIVEGTYNIKTAILDLRTGKAINLSFEGRDILGHYLLGTINLVNQTSTPTASPISMATMTATPSQTSAPTIIASITTTPIPTLRAVAYVTPKPQVLSKTNSNNISVLPQTGVGDNLNIAILAGSGIGLLLFSSFRLK